MRGETIILSKASSDFGGVGWERDSSAGDPVPAEGSGAGGSWFLAILISLELCKADGFSCKEIQTSKPAAMAPAGTSQRQRVPATRRKERTRAGVATAAGW